MISVHADFALVQRLERDIDEAAVAGAAAIAAGEAIHIGHRRIGLDDVDQRFDRVVHHAEGGVLRSLHAADHCARVLLREEALGNLDDQHHVQAMVSNSTISIRPELSSTQGKECR